MKWGQMSCSAERSTIRLSSLKIKGVILAGGEGSRLHPLTSETNKHLLPVGEKPLIFYAIEQLLQAEVKDILVLIDDRHASKFMEVLKDGSHLGVRSLSYVWQPRGGKGLPTAIAQAEPFIRDEKMVVVCGDVIIEEGITQPIKNFDKQTKGARLAATHLKDTAGYSHLITDKRRHSVTNILAKNQERHISGLIDLGVYMYHPDVFEHIQTLAPSARRETEIWDLNKIYAKKRDLFYTVVDGWWCDIGRSVAAYRLANQRYAKK